MLRSDGTSRSGLLLFVLMQVLHIVLGAHLLVREQSRTSSLTEFLSFWNSRFPSLDGPASL